MPEARSRGQGAPAAGPLALAGLLALAQLVSGCGGSDSPKPVATVKPTLTQDQATSYLTLTQRLGRLMAQIAGTPPALTPLGAHAELGGDPAGHCFVDSQIYTVDTWFGRKRPWQDLTGPLQRALGPRYTFHPASGLQGGFDGQDAVDPHTGVRVELRAKGSTTLQVVVPVTGSCDVHAVALTTPPL